METTISQRALTFIAYNKMSVRSFERRCGLSNGYIKSMSNDISADKLDKILHEFPKLNRDWLMHGSGDMLLSDPPAPGASASGNGSMAVTGNENNVNSALVILRAFDEIAAQRKLVESSHQLLEKRNSMLEKRDEQIDRLLSLLEKSQGI